MVGRRVRAGGVGGGERFAGLSIDGVGGGVIVSVGDAALNIGRVDQRGRIARGADAGRGVDQRHARRRGVLRDAVVGGGDAGQLPEVVVGERGLPSVPVSAPSLSVPYSDFVPPLDTVLSRETPKPQ